MPDKDLPIHSAYDLYLNRIISKLESLNLMRHNELLSKTGLKICIFDFCGKLKYYMRYFIDVTSEMYLVEDDYENDISDILNRYDLIYFFDDIEFVDENIFYKEYPNRNNFIFVLFSGGKFEEYKIYND
jgi:hypothetical protein